MKELLSPATWLVAVAVALGAFSLHTLRVNSAERAGYARGVTVGKAEVQRDFDAFKESFRKTHEDELNKVLQANLELQAQLNESQAEFENEKTDLAAAIAELSGRLLERPARPTGGASGGGNVSGAASAASGAPSGGVCPADGGVPIWATGANLYVEDALWLLEEARRADELRAAYRRDRAAYEAAEAELKRLNEQAQERMRPDPVLE